MTTKDFKLLKNELTVDSNNVQQSQKFVLDPLDGTRFLIYCDDTLFSNLLNIYSKLLKQFKEDEPVVEEWSPLGWYDFYMKLELTLYNNGQWVPPCHLQKKGMNYDGFNLTDPNTKPDVDLPEMYATWKESWSTAIFSILFCPGTLPSGEGQQLLKSCCNSGFIFL